MQYSCHFSRQTCKRFCTPKFVIEFIDTCAYSNLGNRQKYPKQAMQTHTLLGLQIGFKNAILMNFIVELNRELQKDARLLNGLLTLFTIVSLINMIWRDTKATMI